MIWLVERHYLPQPTVNVLEFVYLPLAVLGKCVPPFGKLLTWYAQFWTEANLAGLR
jgi:hypothetical protein